MWRSLILVTALVTACARQGEAKTYPFRIRVQSDQGAPVAGAKVTMGTNVGSTLTDGAFDIEFAGKEGTARTLSVVCPTGFEQTPIVRQLLGRTLDALAPHASTHAIRPEIAVVCRARAIAHALVVRTTAGIALPIEIDGRPVATTDKATGLAHVMVQLPRGATYKVTLRTDRQSELRPRNPSFTMHVGDFDDVVPIEQDFERAHHTRATPRRPQRLN